MGLFDFLDDAMDSVFELPGKVIETAAEAVVRIPEIPIKAVEGLIDGVEKGLDKLDDAL